jgi:serine phosphatase RsbU (regulator of sigma subunit)
VTPVAVDIKYNVLFISNSSTDSLGSNSPDQIGIRTVTFDNLGALYGNNPITPDVIVLNIPEGSSANAEEIIPLLKQFSTSKIFVCGRRQDKEKLTSLNKSVFIWEGDCSNLTFETILQLVKLKETKVKFQRESNALKEKMEVQSIMMTELEQTNSNLISATWRERDLKKILANTLSELEKSKDLIEKQNKKISESINYSRRIQNVILPDEEVIKKDLEKSFILYIPKDVVSGDFPFYLKDGEHIYLAAVDCTGHGVPGAMLSLIGNLTLKDILNDPGEKKTSCILSELHSKIVKTLKQDIEGNDTSDGMDIALCAINLADKKLRFSGAHRPLFHLRNGELLEYKGSRLPIGGTQYKKQISYADHEIDFVSGDSFFIFSDGFPDQFGGPGKEKYGPVRIQNYLLANQNLSMDELKEGLRDEFMKWKGDEKQMDDILFMGFKL